MASQRSNQFIEEYAGPVSLYAYLAQRWKVCPIFLRRNLSYKRKHEDVEKKRSDRGLAVSKDKQSSNLSDSPTHTTAHAETGENKGEVQESVNLRRHISSSRKNHLTFRLRFNEGSQESVQKLSELRCLWCDMTCNDLEGLLWHLQASHDRFTYASETATCTPEIYVSVKPSSDISVGFANFCFFSPRKGGPPLQTSVASINAFEEEISREVANSESQVSRGKRKADGKKGHGGEGSSLKPSGRIGKKPMAKSSKASQEKRSERRSFGERQFYRSQTCLPIDPEDLDYDSDDDVDDEWQLAQAERLMDEFEDVTLREKAFMKLWNRFVHRHAILADFQVPLACETFARNFGQQLIEQGLRDELLFHLFALWDFNLVDKEQIQACIGIVDNIKEGERAAASGVIAGSQGEASSSRMVIKQEEEGGSASRTTARTNGGVHVVTST